MRISNPQRAARGETLAEVLVALLIVTLATLLLASMATASAGINLGASTKDEEFYEALSKVEALDGGTKQSGTYNVIITDESASPPTNNSIKVEIYTDENLTMYRRDTTP